MKRLIVIALATLIISPAFACGPGMGGPGTNTGLGGGDTREHKHHRKADHESRQQIQEANRFLREQGRRERLLEAIDMGHGTFSKHSPAETKRIMEDRIGQLMVKYKHGTLTNDDARELQILMHSVMVEEGSGR